MTDYSWLMATDSINLVWRQSLRLSFRASTNQPTRTRHSQRRPTGGLGERSNGELARQRIKNQEKDGSHQRQPGIRQEAALEGPQANTFMSPFLWEKKKTNPHPPKTAEPRMKVARVCPTPTNPPDRPWLSLSQYRNTSLQSLHDPHWFPF